MARIIMINYIIPRPSKFFLCMVFAFLITKGAFAQVPYLLLDSTDVRIEPAVLNGVVGYNLFVRKKAGMESVMLTEPNGYYALRSMERNEVNGGERREFYGAAINDANSQFSILSSTPVSDWYFGYAFWLFVPQNVMYGNPSSPTGMVVTRIHSGFQINIRTFDHKYADPTWGRYQNNQFIINETSVPWDLQYPSPPQISSGPVFPPPAPPVAPPPSSTFLESRESREDRSPYPDSRDQQMAELRRILINIVRIDENLLNRIGDDDRLQSVLKEAFDRLK